MRHRCTPAAGNAARSEPRAASREGLTSRTGLFSGWADLPEGFGLRMLKSFVVAVVDNCQHKAAHVWRRCGSSTAAPELRLVWQRSRRARRTGTADGGGAWVGRASGGCFFRDRTQLRRALFWACCETPPCQKIL